MSPRVERMTKHKNFLIDRINMTPGRNLTCDGPLKQTKVHYTLFYSVLKETKHKALKVAAAKYLCCSVYVFGTTCFNLFYFM